MATLQDGLKAALAALQAGEQDAALESLLASWRARRVPELADLIDRLSPLVAEKAPRVEGKRLLDKQARWIALAPPGRRTWCTGCSARSPR